jgi:hypothetical protein
MAKKEFTENWLQALMLAADNAAARRIRPWMTDIAAISAAALTEGQVESAERLWNYAQGHGLIPFLQLAPLQQTRFQFEDDECFRFERTAPAPALTSAATFIESLGLQAAEWEWTATVTHADWTNLLRKEAVRQSKPLNVQSIPITSSMVEAPCLARWDTKVWTIQFKQPTWLHWNPVGIGLTPRPSSDAIDAVTLDAIAFANQHFKIATKLSAFAPADASWTGSIASLSAWHRSVLITNDVGVHAWFRRVWFSVWPVIYRERNRLKGECDLPLLRKELAECFVHAPELTEWMFLFARLLCEAKFERGLGIAADFVDE